LDEKRPITYFASVLRLDSPVTLGGGLYVYSRRVMTQEMTWDVFQQMWNGIEIFTTSASAGEVTQLMELSVFTLSQTQAHEVAKLLRQS